MALTAEQEKRLHELEEIVEGGIGGLIVKVYLDNYSDDAIWKIGRWAEKISESSPKLSEWLHQICVSEIYRRANQNPTEVSIPRLPCDWSNVELAAALVDAYRLAGSNGLKELDSFFSEVNIKLAVMVSERLRNQK